MVKKKLLSKSISQKNFDKEIKYNFKKTNDQKSFYKNNKSTITLFSNCFKNLKSIKNVSPVNLNINNYSTLENNVNKKNNDKSYSYIV